MQSRLVVMLNSEDAASTFRVENAGKEFYWGGVGNAAEKLEPGRGGVGVGFRCWASAYRRFMCP